MFLGALMLSHELPFFQEGQAFYIKKYVALFYTPEITTKVLSCGTLSAESLVGLLLVLYFKLSIPLCVVAAEIVFGWLPVFLMNYEGILIDLANPMIHWDGEYKGDKGVK